MGRRRSLWLWLVGLVAVAVIGMTGTSVLAFPHGPAQLTVRITDLPDVSVHLIPPGIPFRGTAWIKPTRILLGRDGDTWRAFSNRSTHMGEPVAPWPELRQFRDNNGAQWDAAGRRIGGPAARGLDWYPVTIDGEYAVIDLSRPGLGAR